MYISEKIFEMTFSNKESISMAYKSACMWLAKNILKRDEIGEVTYKIVKLKNTNLPSVRLELFVSLDEGEIFKTHCEACKEVHKGFYFSGTGPNCNECKLNGFRGREDLALKVKAEYRRKQINRTY